jgi:alanyl-tRNA synthetase
MQFEQVSPTERITLPKPSVDTGMGLERIAALLQGTHDNYEIDLFKALISAIASAAGTDPTGPHKASHRVIADHLRSSGFLIADGILPSNEGRGYVLRRIMRRAMRHAHLMGCTEPLMHRLVPALLAEMGSQYPELERARPLITETLLLEETRFKSMLDRGLKLLDEETRSLSKGGRFSGETAFKLYDTFGFPLDLTQDALRGREITVDTDGFNAAMARQKAEARKAWSGSGEAATEKVWFDLREQVGASDFLGYATETAEGKVTALVVDGQPVREAKQGQKIALIANQTPFYGESGGQMGDRGTIVTANKAEIEIADTQKKLDNMHVHIGTVTKGVVAVGDEAQFRVESGHRSAIRGHHSATHLLHAALRRVLGEHVTQKGSMVAHDRLRFDISHNKALAPEEIRVVEDLVNSEIRANEAVTTRLMAPEAAVEAGAMALFGEKYGEEVRVVAMGRMSEAEARNYSVELCGGTHVSRTGDIGLFKIVSESAVAAGVRRIEAVTGAAAEAYVVDEERMLKDAAAVLRVGPADLPARIAAMVEERRKLERELSDVRKKLATGGGGGAAAAAQAKTISGIAFSGRVLADVPGKDLKGIADEMKKQIVSGVIALISTMEGKANVVVGVTDDLVGKISAVDLVRAGSAAVGGKGGGGRPDMAQAGGPEGNKAAEALQAIETELAGLAA